MAGLSFFYGFSVASDARGALTELRITDASPESVDGQRALRAGIKIALENQIKIAQALDDVKQMLDGSRSRFPTGRQ